MPHVIESASSGRARCRGCGRHIPKGTLRLGERLPNLFGEGDMTLWFHLACGAYKRPQAFLDAVAGVTDEIPERATLEREAREGLEHRRVTRIDCAQRAPSGRSHCRSCRELIEKDTWRIRLVYYEEGRFEPSGYVHARCAREYFETKDVVERLLHFSPEISEAEVEALRAELDQ